MAKSLKTTKAKSSKGTRRTTNAVSAQRYRMREEIVAIVLIVFGCILTFGMYFEAAGKFGAALSGLLKGCFGYVGFAVPIVIVTYGVLMLIGTDRFRGIRPIVFVLILFVLFNILLSGTFIGSGGELPGKGTVSVIYNLSRAGDAGGVVGMFAASLIVKYIGKVCLYIFTIALILIVLILIINAPMSKYAGVIKEKTQPARELRRERRLARIEERAARAEMEYEEYYEEGNELNQDYGNEPRGSESGFADSDAYVSPRESFRSFLPSFLGGKRASEGNSGRDKIVELLKNDEIYGEGTDKESYGEVGGEDDIAGGGAYSDDIEFGIEPQVYRPSGMGLGDEDITTSVSEPTPYTFEAPDTTDTQDMAQIKARTPKAAPSKQTDSFAVGKMSFDNSANDYKNYRLPPVNLLKKGTGKAKHTSDAELKKASSKLEQALRDFKVDAMVTGVTVGPTVTRYEVEPDVGVKIQAIRSLEPDLALKLEVKSVRVVPMPGKAVVGIEAYNASTNVVTLRELIESDEFQGNPSKISFVLGKNISGKNIIADLKEMPHLLIAGTTGSGKSVCINSILLSILYHATPDQVRLILIDPKVVELKLYNEIPHLLVPVVTEPERAAMALSYAVTLMNDRYKKFAEHNVRNLGGYNQRMMEDGMLEEVMPEIVIVIDELSDLMMVASAKVQESISRLAAMARAAGMHLIVATQQPLASILTSVIKANIPSRVAFSVSSNSASRVILDDAGAERLLGKGDMLFSPVGTREPMRVQGSFVTDDEIGKVTDFIKKQANPDYSDSLTVAISTDLNAPTVDDEDDLFISVVQMVSESKQGTVSVSMIQRRFRVGYNRAARLVDMLEERGIVGPTDGTNKPRKIIMTKEQIDTFLYPEGDLLSKINEPDFDKDNEISELTHEEDSSENTGTGISDECDIHDECELESDLPFEPDNYNGGVPDITEEDF